MKPKKESDSSPASLGLCEDQDLQLLGVGAAEGRAAAEELLQQAAQGPPRGEGSGAGCFTQFGGGDFENDQLGAETQPKGTRSF